MNIRMKVAAIALAVAALVGASAEGCGSGSGGGNNSGPCIPESGKCGPSVGVSANPKPTNGGVGQVSGICHFSLTSPSGDKGAGGSGLRPKKMGPVLINIVGYVWGYCTDLVHSFTIDISVYGGPPGTHTSGTDFTKNKRAHELSYREVKKPIPGPIPTPYAITLPCVPGLEMQLVYTYTAADPADNFIGGGPLGGDIVQFTRENCGAAS